MIFVWQIGFSDYMQIAHPIWEELRTVVIFLFNGFYLRGVVVLQTQPLCSRGFYLAAILL